MRNGDGALLARAARAAGAIALTYWRADPMVWDKGEAGPVSEADLAANAHLHDMLRAARPGYGWLSEESAPDPGRHRAERCFIVDPIDGTRAFIAGEKTWSVSLAVADAGAVVAAAVFLPALDRLYLAEKGAGATFNGVQIRCSEGRDPDTARILAARPVMVPDNWQGGTPPGTRHFRPSLAYRLCLVAEGRYDAMLALRATWEWDIAAGCLIVAEAGGMATMRSGAPLLFNTASAQTNGCLAAPPALHGALLKRLA